MEFCNKLFEELKEINDKELEKFLQQVENDIELNVMVTSSIKEIPFYQHLMTGSFAPELSMLDYILNLYKRRKDIIKYFIYNNNHYEGFLAYTISLDKKIAGDIKLLKFYDDSATSTAQDTLDLLNKLIIKFPHVQFSASNSNRVNLAYKIFLKRKEKEGYKTEIYEDDGDQVYNIYNELK